MIRRPPRSTLDRSSAASDVYKRQILSRAVGAATLLFENNVNGYFTETSQVALSNTFKDIMQDRKKLSEMKKASADIFTKVYEEHDQQLTDIIAQATKFDLSK